MTIKARGKITTPQESADYLFSCYHTANYNQTHRVDRPVFSWAHDLQLSGGNMDRLAELMRQSLTGIYSQSFDERDIIVNVKPIDDSEDTLYFSMRVSMKLKTKDTGLVFDFALELSKISRTIDNVNEAKKQVTIRKL